MPHAAGKIDSITCWCYLLQHGICCCRYHCFGTCWNCRWVVRISPGFSKAQKLLLLQKYHFWWQRTLVGEGKAKTVGGEALGGDVLSLWLTDSCFHCFLLGPRPTTAMVAEVTWVSGTGGGIVPVSHFSSWEVCSRRNITFLLVTLPRKRGNP